jgi:hypothetical protein
MAGMVACLWQAFPEKTNREIRDLILQSSDKFSVPNNQYGYGIPDFNLAVSSPLDVNSFSKDDFIIYPNPASDFVTVSLPSKFEMGTVVLYTLLGQKILEQKVTPQSSIISLKTLEKGMYFYKMESVGLTKTGKILKQ